MDFGLARVFVKGHTTSATIYSGTELWGAESTQSPILIGPLARGGSNALLLQFFFFYIWGKKPHLLHCGSVSSTPVLVPRLFRSAAVVNFHYSRPNSASVLSSCYSWYLLIWNCLQLKFGGNNRFNAEVHVKAVLTSLNTALLPISRSRFKRRWISLFISLTFGWRFCENFWVSFGHFGKFFFFSKDRLNWGKYEMLQICWTWKIEIWSEELVDGYQTVPYKPGTVFPTHLNLNNSLLIMLQILLPFTCTPALTLDYLSDEFALTM